MPEEPIIYSQEELESFASMQEDEECIRELYQLSGKDLGTLITQVDGFKKELDKRLQKESLSLISRLLPKRFQPIPIAVKGLFKAVTSLQKFLKFMKRK